MQNEAQTKMVGAAQNNKADMATNVVAISSIRNSYFFPGGGVWKPMNVEATNLTQAEEIHKATRQPIAAEKEEKVEDSETNNE